MHKGHLDNALCACARLGIHLYRYSLGWLLGGQCRFYPSCSAYALEAFSKKSFPAALALTLKRIVKCHPLHPGGYDPLEEEGSDHTRNDAPRKVNHG